MGMRPVGISLRRRGAGSIREGICSRSLVSLWSGGTSPRQGAVSHGISCWLNGTHVPLALAVLLSNFSPLWSLTAQGCGGLKREKALKEGLGLGSDVDTTTYSSCASGCHRRSCPSLQALLPSVSSDHRGSTTDICVCVLPPVPSRLPWQAPWLPAVGASAHRGTRVQDRQGLRHRA